MKAIIWIIIILLIIWGAFALFGGDDEVVAPEENTPAEVEQPAAVDASSEASIGDSVTE